MRSALIMLAAIAAPSYAMIARGQDSSNFLMDTAPQGYNNVITQISDGQVQVPTAAPAPPAPVPSSPAAPVVPPVVSSEPAPVVPPVESQVSLPVETTGIFTTPVETVPIAPPATSVIYPPSSAVEVPSAIITATGAPTFPNATTTLRTTSAAATVSAPPSETTPPTAGASNLQAFSTFGLVAAVAALFL